MALSHSCRTVIAPSLRARQFHASAVACLPRQTPGTPATSEKRHLGLPYIPDDIIEKDQGEDSTAYGHWVLQRQRQLLYYMRLIEHEMPRLVAYRKPFVPPSESMPLVIRSISYGGEEHPAELKRTIVVPVARLPLKDASAIHKFKLLASTRWTPNPPSDSGISESEGAGEHGYFKIACEDFPKPAMNLKWASDALDRLLTEANNSQEKFDDVPLDTRHLDAKARKAKKGDHVYGRGGNRPTLKDFPKEWLPSRPQSTTTQSAPSAT